MPITVSALNIYPVKGLKGIALEEARCTDRGIEHDRRFMLVDPEGMFYTQREHPKMAKHSALSIDFWTTDSGTFCAQ